MGGPSSQEKQLQSEQAAETQAYIGQQSTLFGESQALQATLTPLLQQEISNPTGFSPQELADLNASNVNTTGAQYANVQKQVNLANASNNMAGLTSGVAAGETAALQGAAAGTVATNAQNTQLQSAQLATQKQQTAIGQLQSLESGDTGAAISQGQVENQGESAAFNQANTEQQQSSQLMNGILGGLVNTGLGVASGGLTNAISGMGGGGGSPSLGGI
jgi:hypothetical protein